MKLPVKLDIIPILECIFEIRFETNSPVDVNVGLIYKEFSKKYFSNPIPINQTSPNEIVIGAEPKYISKQQMSSIDGKFLLRYGQNVISLHLLTDYEKFNDFNNQIKSVLETLKNIDVVTSITRIGLRYIDFFSKEQITNYDFNLLNAEFKIGGFGPGEKISFTTTLQQKEANHQIQFFRALEINHKGTIKTGDLFDIDSFLDNPTMQLEEISNTVPRIHEEQKIIFFNTIGEKLVKLMGPTYE